MQFQIVINIGRINPITTFTFGSVLKLHFDDFFHIAFGCIISLEHTL